MLALDIQHKGRCLSLELPLPTDILAGELRAFGIEKTLSQIQRADVLLQPTNELGEHFMKLVQPDDTLQAIATYCREFDLLYGESRQALTDLLMTDRLRDLDHMADYLQYGPAALVEPTPTETLTFYCPLAVSCYDDGAEPVKLSNRYLVRNEEEIREALRAEMHEGENMADYLEDNLKEKISSVEWDIETINGTAYGKITCELRATLTPEEQEELIEECVGQAADGLGEGFEQRPVKTSDGELYVHLWQWSDDYFLLPEDEFRARILDQPMSEAPRAADPKKPDCPLVGQDGNIFGLIGLAARTLRQHGLHDQAKEMTERAFGSGSYTEALGAITDYVNVTSVEGEMDEDEDDDWCREPEYDEEDQDFGGGIGGMA